VLSPTISPRALLEEWNTAQTGEQRQSYYNRKLGRPYADPSKIPVNREHLNACVEAGKSAGIEWKAKARDTYMGIDQMGGFNAILVKERLPDGRQALIHAAAHFGEDPFAAADEVMTQYGVSVAVVEGLPNWNDAKRFANRHPGRVFVASYGDSVDTMSWGDQLVKADRKTDEDERDRWTVRLNQYKAMQASLDRIVQAHCLFPDPAGIECNYQDGGERRVLLLRDIVFEHLTRVALISERDPETSRWRTYVKKVGMDPHYAYANMLCDVAFSRAHGVTSVLIPHEDKPVSDTAQNMPGLPDEIVNAIDNPIPHSETCASCIAFDAERGFCTERHFTTRASDVACDMYLPSSL
jgi:hypothetical protein